jgi:hypothetical protein
LAAKAVALISNVVTTRADRRKVDLQDFIHFSSFAGKRAANGFIGSFESRWVVI